MKLEMPGAFYLESHSRPPLIVAWSHCMHYLARHRCEDAEKVLPCPRPVHLWNYASAEYYNIVGIC